MEEDLGTKETLITNINFEGLERDGGGGMQNHEIDIFRV